MSQEQQQSLQPGSGGFLQGGVQIFLSMVIEGPATLHYSSLGHHPCHPCPTAFTCETHPPSKTHSRDAWFLSICQGHFQSIMSNNNAAGEKKTWLPPSWSPQAEGSAYLFVVRPSQDQGRTDQAAAPYCRDKCRHTLAPQPAQCGCRSHKPHAALDAWDPCPSLLPHNHYPSWVQPRPETFSGATAQAKLQRANPLLC